MIEHCLLYNRQEREFSKDPWDSYRETRSFQLNRSGSTFAAIVFDNSLSWREQVENIVSIPKVPETY
jgi:hypothetical protein